MKEQYIAPKTEVILLEEEDIILTSTGVIKNRLENTGGEVDVNLEGAATFF